MDDQGDLRERQLLQSTTSSYGSSVPVGDFRMQPFGREIVAMVDRHAPTTAVAINDFLAGAGEVKFQGRPVVRWENRRRLLLGRKRRMLDLWRHTRKRT